MRSLKSLKKLGGLKSIQVYQKVIEQGNDKELNLEEILDNGKGKNEDDNDDIDIEVHNIKKPSFCQQTVIKTVTTTVLLWPEASTAPKTPAPAAPTLAVPAPMAPAPVAIPLRWKANVVGNLTDELEQASLVKNNQKQTYNIGVEKIKCLNICERLNIKKRQLNQASKQIEMEEKVEMRKLALEK